MTIADFERIANWGVHARDFYREMKGPCKDHEEGRKASKEKKEKTPGLFPQLTKADEQIFKGIKSYLTPNEKTTLMKFLNYCEEHEQECFRIVIAGIPAGLGKVLVSDWKSDDGKIEKIVPRAEAVVSLQRIVALAGTGTKNELKAVREECFLDGTIEKDPLFQRVLEKLKKVKEAVTPEKTWEFIKTIDEKIEAGVRRIEEREPEDREVERDREGIANTSFIQKLSSVKEWAEKEKERPRWKRIFFPWIF